MTRNGVWFYFCLFVLAAGAAQAVDWPVIGHDMDHSGVTPEQLQLPLGTSWVYQADCAPSPIDRGMQNKANANTRTDLTDPIAYDYVFDTVIQSNRLFFGSSTEESVYCLNASTGARQWVFRAGGAVRHAPVLDAGKVYFGSDDGTVYCLNAVNGAEVWRFRAAPSNYRCIGNQRITSAWPVRTGVVITNGSVYFACGIYPTQGSYLYALNASTGAKLWERKILITPNGLITIADNAWIWVSTGKTSPMEFSLADGTPRIAEPDKRMGCGSWFVGKVDGLPVYGPSDSEAQFIRLSTNAPPLKWGDTSYDYSNAVPRGILSGLNGFRMMADAQRFYWLGRSNDVKAVSLADFRAAATSRAQEIAGLSEWAHGWQAYNIGETDDAPFTADLNAVTLWQTAVSDTNKIRAAVLAGDTLFLGGVNKIYGLNAATGAQTWSAAVNGEARGLAVADGALYVSTDVGKIYCFKNGATTPVTYSPSFSNPYSADSRYSDAAQTAINQAGRSKGICLMLGAGNGQLAYEIAQRSSFFVVALDPDASAVAAARTNLAQAGLYGSRVVVYHETNSSPAFADYFANLIVSGSAVSGGGIPYTPKHILRMLQPYGGTAVFGSDTGGLNLSAWTGYQLSGWTPTNGTSGITWQVARRGTLPGAGEWSHHFGNLANTVNSGEQLVSTNLQIQWFGAPGPYLGMERHSFGMPPLVKNGKMYRMTGVKGASDGKGTISCIDVYNGTEIWSKELKACLRMGAPINTHAYASLGDRYVFNMSTGSCYQLDAATGNTLYTYNGALSGYDWGYSGCFSNLLIGTSQGLDADKPALLSVVMDSSWSTFMCKPSCSKNLFVYNTDTHQKLWTWTGGAILNVSITVNEASNVIYFVESRNSASIANTTGLIDMGAFLQREGTNGAQIVALNLATGSVLWTKPVTRNIDKPYQWIMYLTYADGVLLASRTYDQTEADGQLHFGYDFEALNAVNGDSLWNVWNPSPVSGEITGLSNGKNAMNSHPYYMNGKFCFFARTYGVVYSYDRLTGAVTADPTIGTGWEQKEGKSCTPPVAGGSNFYFRFNSNYQYDPQNQELHDLTRVSRPGCWMSTIPAQGLVMMADGSTACSCGFPLQQSAAFAGVLPAEEAVNDSDGDGLPDEWEQQYFGGVTNANPNAMASNGVNTIYETYIAGLNPTNSQSLLMLFDLRSLAAGNTVQWQGVSGRVYTVSWSSNLLNGFQPLETNVPWTGNIFTDAVHSTSSEGFYKIEARLAP